jgi:hypothetical protein
MPYLAISATKANVAGSGVHTTTTDAIDTSLCDLIVLVVSSQTPTSSVSDSKGNAWTALTGINSGNGSIQLFYSIAPTVGAGHTFSVTGPYASVHVLGIVAGTSTFDQQNCNATGSSNIVTTGSVTPTEDAEIVVVGTANAYESTSLPRVDGNYLGNATYTKLLNDNHYSTGAFFGVLHTAAATNPTITAAGGSFCAAAIATFTASNGAEGGGGGGAGGVSRARSVNFGSM